MINEKYAKSYCPEDISLIENYHTAVADKEKKWEIHHRRECDDEGRTLSTQAIDRDESILQSSSKRVDFRYTIDAYKTT